MSSPIEQAIRQIVEEKGLSYESVLEAIETALAAAYRKDFGNRMQNLEAKFNVDDGSVRVWDVKTVVEDRELSEEDLQALAEEEKRPEDRRERTMEPKPTEAPAEDEDAEPKFNPKTQIMATPAQQVQAGAVVGDVLRTELEVPGGFGRMAAMTAKQVITQKLREAERAVVYNDFKGQEGEVLVGTIQRREGRVVLVDIGRGTAVMRPEDQMPGERYVSGERMKVYLRSVGLGVRGPEILVSRTAPELVAELFKTEVPEIADGTVKIEAIAREAGSRSKVAVSCQDDSIDPIGACIGQRGARIQTIIAELGTEKVDIIEHDADAGVFVMNALSPAKVQSVDLNETTHVATVTVDADQLSLAIGRGGQNVRLAARLTGWRVNVAEIDGTLKGSSEGAVRDERPMPSSADAVADEAAVEAEVAEDVQAAEVQEELTGLQVASESDDDVVDADDEGDDDAEGADEGIASDELPAQAMEGADDNADSESNQD